MPEQRQGSVRRSRSLAVPCIPLVLGSSACSESGPHINGVYSSQNSSSRSPNTVKFLNFKFQIEKKGSLVGFFLNRVQKSQHGARHLRGLEQ